MGNTDKTLQDKDYLNIYPITRERNVYDENNVNLKTKFENVVFKDNDVHKFAQELYDESKNLFNSKKLIQGSTLEAISTRVNSFIKKVTAGETFVCSLYNSNLRYTFGFCKENRQIANNVIKETGWKTASGATLTSTEDGYLFITISTNPDGTSIKPSDVGENDIQLESGNIVTEFHQYNPNRHITNPQAEFLKEEHEESYNLWNNEEKGSIDENTGVNNYSETRWRTKDYIEAKPNTKYTLNAVTSSALWFIFYFYTSSKIFISSDAKNGTSNTITTPNDCYYIRCVVADTSSISSSNRQLTQSGDRLPYQPYNSSSHITNPQAAFLKSEWEKSVNLLNIRDGIISSQHNLTYTLNSDDTFNIVGTPQYTWANIIENNKIILDIGTYTFSTNKALPFRTAIKFTFEDNTTREIVIETNTRSITFTLSKKTKSVNIFFAYLSTSTEYNITDIGFQVENGDKATIVQEHNGKIIHEKDIEPVLLWKFGQIDVTQEKQENLTMLSREGYKYIIIAYQEYKGWEYVRRYAKFKMISSTRNVIVINDSHSPSTMSSRRVIIGDNTTFTINEAYVDGAQNNNVIIIQEVYGSNY